MKEVLFNPVRNLHSDNYQDSRFTRVVAGGFWVFNLLYVVGISLIAGPMILASLWPAVQIGNAPAHHLVVVTLAMLLPVVVCVFVYRSALYRNHAKLSEFFVGVELPVAAVLIGRSLWAHELSVMSIALYGFMLSVAAAQCWLLMQRKVAGIQVLKSPTRLTLGISAFVCFGGIYLSILALVFTSPVLIGSLVLSLVMFAAGFIYFENFPPLVLLMPCAAIVGLSIFLVVLRFVLYVPYCFYHQWCVRHEQAVTVSHRAVTPLVWIVCVTAFLLLHYQARSHDFKTLEVTSDSEVKQLDLLKRAESIKADLLDAYLAPVRYLPQHRGMANPLFGLRNGLLTLLLPSLVYQGDSSRSQLRAEQYYENMFDAPIQRTERKAIVKAYKNHWSLNSQPEAGLIDIGQRTVHVESQNLGIEVNHGIATVTVQEVLMNRTARSLETFQYFTLPEDAVVTGLWLSDTVAEPRMFEYQVAPRGAAQQVYKEQVQIRVDPALLELVGPRQYRLRVFPVLPATPMVVTMTYKTLPDKKGNWPLPVLREQRNIFWNRKTKRLINGEALNINDESQWLPQHIALQDVRELPAKLHLGYMDDGKYISAKPLPAAASSTVADRTAILIDGSYSMSHEKRSVLTLLQLMTNTDMFFCKADCTRTNLDNNESWVFFGQSQPLEQLSSFQQHDDYRSYDSVILLSDGGSYETQSDQKAIDLDVPTWMLELGLGAHAYRDSLTDSLRRSGGGIVNSVEQAVFERRAGNDARDASQSGGIPSDKKLIAVTSKHAWFESEQPAQESNPELAQIVAGLKIKQLGKFNESGNDLDLLHEIALEHGIVSAYSSMIVLVNDAQRRRLKDLSSREDRFKREVETGKKIPVVATAVPEPHEWALMGIGLLLLVITAHRRGWTLRTALQLPPMHYHKN